MDRTEETDASVGITKHARQRSKERVGLSKSSLERLLPRIISDGRRAKDFTGSFRKYLNSLHRVHHTGKHKDVIVYSLQIYVIVNHSVITVMQVPRKYIKIVTNSNKPRGVGTTEGNFQRIRKKSRCNT